jgi:Ca2+-binding EF-hand superfamily protein
MKKKNRIISALIIGTLLVSTAGSVMAAGGGGYGAGKGSGSQGQHFMDSWDANEDGTVTIEEVRIKRDEVFYSFDSDENGYLNAEEYVYFDEARANDMANEDAGMKMGEHKAANSMLLENSDLDGDGRVSLEEFLDGAKTSLLSMDKNGDGVITKADFGR